MFSAKNIVPQRVWGPQFSFKFTNRNSQNGGNYDAGIYYKNGYWYAFRYGATAGEASGWKEQRLNESRTGKTVKIEMKFMPENGINKVMLFIDGYRINTVSNTSSAWQVNEFLINNTLYAKFEANIVSTTTEMALFNDKNAKGCAFFKNAIVSDAVCILPNGSMVTPLSRSFIISSDEGRTTIANAITTMTNKTGNVFKSTIDLNKWNG